jgi:hypothetical protein
MSGSSAGDFEGGEGPGRVAGVVAEGGSEVDRPGPAERADGEVAQAGHDVRAGTGPDLRAVLSEEDIADPVPAVLDRPVPRRRSASRAGLAWAKVRLVIA